MPDKVKLYLNFHVTLMVIYIVILCIFAYTTIEKISIHKDEELKKSENQAKN